MAPFDWIDQRLLKVAERAVKKWNWLTGKDQFALARLVSKVGRIVALASSVAGLFLVGLSPVLVLFVVLVTTSSYISDSRLINTIEAVREHEMMHGIKFITTELLLEHLRRGNLSWCVAMVFMLLIFASISILYAAVNNFLFVLPATRCAVQYLISVDQPPFKRSRLRRYARFLLRKLVKAVTPVPEPEPVPVPRG